MMQRQQMITIGVLVAAVLGLLVALRMQFTTPPAQPEEEYVAERPASASRSNNTRVTTFDDYDPEVALPRREARVRTVAAKDWVENHDMWKLRATGDAYVQGIVSDEDGAPLPGAEVMLYEPDPMTSAPALRTAVTDTEGSYTLADVNRSGVQFILAAKAPGHAPEVRFVTMNGPQRLDITLEKGVTLSGSVLDATTSAPIGGATVYFPATPWTVFAFLGTTISDGTGRFTFTDVKAGRSMTVAEASGYARTSRTVRSPANDAVIPMRPGGAVIRGMTVTRLGSKPAGGARVVLYSRNGGVFSTTSRQDGTFELRDLPGGNHTLLAFKGAPSRPERVQLQDNSVKEDVTLVLPSEVYVNGRVIRADNSRPLPGIGIKYQGVLGGDMVLSDEEGRFNFTTLAVDSYWVEVSERGLVPVSDRSTTSVAERVTRNIEPGAASDELVLKMRGVPAITGVVRQARGGGEPAPVWNAEIFAHVESEGELLNLRARSDTNGAFFVNLPEFKRGYARVFARRGRAVALAETRAPVRRPLRMTLTQDILRGEVYLTDMSPLSGVRVSAVYQFPGPAQYGRLRSLVGDMATAGLYGNFVLPLVRDNQVKLNFRLPDNVRVEKDFSTNALVRRDQVFVYDPVTKDIMHDARGGGGGRREGGERPRGEGRGRGEGGRDGGRPRDTWSGLPQ